MLNLKPLLRFTCISAVTLVVISLGSCSDHKKTDSTGASATNNSNNNLVSDSTKVLQVPTLKLTKQQLQAWYDSGWTKPSDPGKLIKKLLIQFYSANTENISVGMQGVVYPARSYTDIFVGGRLTLEIDTSQKALTVSGPVIFGNNFASFKNLKITNPDGTLNDFSHIRFKPILNSKDKTYLSFELEVIGTGPSQTVSAKEGSDPCPPYCPDGDD